jgi:hypothetical protein
MATILGCSHETRPSGQTQPFKPAPRADAPLAKLGECA